MKELSYEEAHQLFWYDFETGKLYWRVDRRGRVKADDEAGVLLRARRTQYRQTMVHGKSYLVHRIVWLMHYGKWPESDIDHIDGNGLNNRIENLRDVMRLVNLRNSRMRRNNSSGVNGVYWHKSERKWRAQSCDGSGKRKTLGRFTDLADAERAVKEFQSRLGFSERHGVAQ